MEKRSAKLRCLTVGQSASNWAAEFGSGRSELQAGELCSRVPLIYPLQIQGSSAVDLVSQQLGIPVA